MRLYFDTLELILKQTARHKYYVQTISQEYIKIENILL